MLVDRLLSIDSDDDAEGELSINGGTYNRREGKSPVPCAPIQRAGAACASEAPLPPDKSPDERVRVRSRTPRLPTERRLSQQQVTSFKAKAIIDCKEVGAVNGATGNTS